jgi:hypothetical protein
MKEKNFLWWVVFILLFIWQLPQNIVALVMMPFLGKLKLIKSDKYCLAFVGEKMTGGISLGSFIFISKYMGYVDRYVAHEYGHAVDSHIMGPLYLLIIGIPSLMNAWFNFTDCYYDWYTERLANKHAGLEIYKVGNTCRTRFIKK